MKMMKRISAGLLTLMLVLALSACGSSGESADVLLQKSEETLSNAESMRCDLTITAEMSGLGQSLSFTQSATCDMIRDPATLKAVVSMDMNELEGSVTEHLYVVSNDDGLMAYMAEDDGSGELEWKSTPINSLEDIGMDQYNAENLYDEYAGSSDSYTIVGTETIDGISTTHIEGIISGADLSEAMEATGMLEMFSSLGISDTSALDDMDDLPVSFWVANDTNYPVKLEVDMTTMIQALLDSILADLGGGSVDFSVDQYLLSITFSAINELTGIDLPPEIAG